jgi:hypothetical protein
VNYPNPQGTRIQNCILKVIIKKKKKKGRRRKGKELNTESEN